MQWLIWLGVLVMAAPAWGTTYYVAAGSSNSNNCTLAQNITTPISTVQNGAHCLTTGSTDTLYIRAGVYNLGAWSGPPSGTSSHPLTIAGYPNDGSLAVQLNVGASGANGITLTSQSYLIFDNLILDAAGAGAAAFKITNTAHHIRLQNSEIRNAGTQGILANTGQFGSGSNPGFNEFIHLHVHHNGHDPQFDHGIYLATSDSLIEGCDIHDNANLGVHMFNGVNGSNTNNIIRRNRVHNNGVGVLLGDGNNNIAYNNLVYANGAGIQIRNGGSNNQAYNNTVSGNSGGDSGGACVLNVNDNSAICNNICWGNELDAITGGGSLNPRACNNSSNLFRNPNFVNAAGGDFHLQSGSPAIDTGVSLAGIFTDDFEGNSRPVGTAWDIGAYEFGGTGGGGNDNPSVDQ